MIDELDVDNALKGKLGFAMHSKVKGKMKRERIPQFSGDGKGAYVMMPMTDAVLKERLGYDFQTSNQIPTSLTKGSGTSLSEVYFGNWEELLIGSWGSDADNGFSGRPVMLLKRIRPGLGFFRM